MPRAKKSTKSNVAAIVESQFSLVPVSPKTLTQQHVFDSYANGDHLFLSGFPGTGKTFIAVYLALKDFLSGFNQYERIIIVRSPTPVVDQGFLPGDIKDKMANFEQPVRDIVDKLIDNETNAYTKLKNLKYLEFMSTSFIRGITLDNSIIIVDEFASANFHELDSIVTRLGENSRIIFCGDYKQSDLDATDRKGIRKFMSIMKRMPSMTFVEFSIEDCVRSGFVLEYLRTKDELED